MALYIHWALSTDRHLGHVWVSYNQIYMYLESSIHDEHNLHAVQLQTQWTTITTQSHQNLNPQKEPTAESHIIQSLLPPYISASRSASHQSTPSKPLTQCVGSSTPDTKRWIIRTNWRLCSCVLRAFCSTYYLNAFGQVWCVYAWAFRVLIRWYIMTYLFSWKRGIHERVWLGPMAPLATYAHCLRAQTSQMHLLFIIHLDNYGLAWLSYFPDRL